MECAGDHAVHRAVDDAQAQRERHAHQVCPPGQRRRKEVLHRQAQEIGVSFYLKYEKLD